jgi:site-specific recombinase XerD
MASEPLVLTTATVAFPAVVSNFIIDRQARGRSMNTIRFYRDELGLFARWLDGQKIHTVAAITPDVLRAYFVDLAERRNKGGVHTSFRAIKACLHWLEIEEDGDYKNPVPKVSIPAARVKALPGIPIGDIQRMIDACRGELALRDQTILRSLLDTGARAFEFVALDLGDLDLATGAVKIQRGKGDKERTVYFGANCRKYLRRYLKERTHLRPSSPLWLTDEGDRLSKRGLRGIVQRRADDAGILVPGLHDFRRAFALNMWRNGVDLLAISRLMGHSTVEVTRRYIAEFNDDLRASHAKGSPVDNADL